MYCTMPHTPTSEHRLRLTLDFGVDYYPNSPPGLFDTTHDSQYVNWWQNAIAWTGIFRHYATTGDFVGEAQALNAMQVHWSTYFEPW